MSHNYNHIPVMLKEALEELHLCPGTIAIDATAGGGGHLRAMLEIIGENGLVIGIDQDARALKEDAAGKLAAQYPSQLKLVCSTFSKIPSILDSLQISKVDAILCDLGVSSEQIDVAKRGFSFLRDGPIDMRMDESSDITAYEILARLDERALANILYDLGDERFSRRIARKIKKNWPIPNSTLVLAQLIKSCVPYSRSRVHPATRTFQALRIFVNRELDELESLLKQLPSLLNPGGRAVFISFHSLEDRRVKIAFRSGAKMANSKTLWKLLHRRPIRPTKEEIEKNPRSRSARMRSIERL